MPRFLAGLILGALSGVVTYALTGEQGPALAAAAVVAVLTWLGVAAVLFLDD
ncbi:hypothetical protein [Streptomyces sp. TP-A0875]|uniref:hypothetical protein n=1 Tax=Streptomyces sp. TP-A0875 TaxID=552354 RepID=UPI000A627AB2|nr:hypothetical protein [Streptomyces sp. TP-A0875]